MSGPIVTMPPVPELGIPEGSKEAGQRVDFRPDQFDLMIETKGYLLAWTRACCCPCAPVATQTESPDPNCTLCNGSGWFYFGGNTTQDFDTSDWDLDDIQRNIITDSSAMVIRGVVTGIGMQPDPWDKMGNWLSGTMMLTVRHQNKLGYYDKIVLLDSEIVYSEIVTADGTAYLSTRYLMTGVNTLRTASQVYQADADYQLLGDGRVKWLVTPPVADIRLAIHYFCHPTFLLIEHPHAIRTTSRKFKTTAPKTPRGDPRNLPVQALMRYDFLPEPEVS